MPSTIKRAENSTKHKKIMSGWLLMVSKARISCFYFFSVSFRLTSNLIFFVDLHDFIVRATFPTRFNHHVEPLERHKNQILSSLVFVYFSGETVAFQLILCCDLFLLVFVLHAFEMNVNQIVFFFSSSFNKILPLSIGCFFFHLMLSFHVLF